MSKTFFAAALVAYTSAYKIAYPGDKVDLIKIDPAKYPMVFKWPEEGFRCGATMVSPQIALTAAHCIRADWDNSDPNLTVRLSDGDIYGIKEIRTNECWDFQYGGPYSADIAIMILDRPIPNAKEHVHYIPTWNAETMDDVVGREFELAGWGASGAINDEGDGDESHMRYQIFHRGYNVVNAIVNNMLIYTMDRPENGGLPLEAMGHYGDSGSGALLFEHDGTFDEDGFPQGKRWIIGVKSNGGPAQYGTSHQYTRVGGYHRKWVEDNLVSLNERIPADGCGGDDSDDVYDQCEDTNRRDDGSLIADQDNDPCTLYAINQHWCGNYDTNEFQSLDMCCACGGGRDLDDNNGGGDDSDGNTDDDGGNNQSVQDLIDAALNALEICSTQAEAATQLFTDISNNYSGLYDAVEKSSVELTKAVNAKAATAEYLGMAQESSADVEELSRLKNEAQQQQQIATRAAKEVIKAKKAGVTSGNKLIQNAEAIATPQETCEAALATAFDSLHALTENHASDLDAIGIVDEAVVSINMDLAFLTEFGTSTTIKSETEVQIAMLNERVQAANNAKKGTNSDKKKINQLYKRANQGSSDKQALIEWTEGFQIPADEGQDCKVRGSRKDYIVNDKHTHDFIIFYLSGECNQAGSTQEEQVKFQKNEKFWRNTIAYDGELTDLIDETDKVREFNLQVQGTDRIAFRINQKVRKMIPKTPRRVTVTDLDLETP